MYFLGPFEHGIDAGGLKCEYFGDLLRDINSSLFEGKEDRRVSIHSWEKANLMQLAGIMIAHCILHSGITFPVLAPYVYHYIATGEKELSAGFLDVDDIRKTPANLTLHGLIQDVSVLIQQNYIYNSFSPISKFTVYIHCDIVTYNICTCTIVGIQ